MPLPAVTKKRRFLRGHSPRQWMIALSGFFGAMLWYALPDYVTTGKGRFFARLLTLLGLGGLGGVVLSDTVSKVREDMTMESPDDEAWEMTSDNIRISRENLNLPMLITLFIFGGVFAAGSIWLEFWLFRRGERRRLAGVPLAHTRQALPLSVLFASAYLLDDSLSK